MESFGHRSAAIFPDTPDKFEISVIGWTCCHETAVEALLQFQKSKTSWKPSIISRAYTLEKIIQTDEPVDESEAKLKNPEGVNLNRTGNFRNQNERNTDFDRVSMLIDFLCEENTKCKKLTERNSILEKEVQNLKAELESLTEIFLQKESPSTEVNDHTSSKDYSEVWQIPTRTVNGKRPLAKSKSLVTISNGFSALQDDVDDKRDDSSLKSDNGSISIQMENSKLKQKVQYLESKVDQRKVNRPNSSEIMKRDSGGKSRYSSHGNIQIADEDRQTHMKEISKDHQVKDEVVTAGDSMIKDIDPRGLSRINKTLVKSYSGATSKDIVVFVKPAAGRKGIILHSGINDLKQNEPKSTLEQILDIGHVIHAIS